MLLIETKKSDPRLQERMRVHYSSPGGLMARTICYAIMHNGVYYGHIVAGSACLHLQGRDAFFDLTPTPRRSDPKCAEKRAERTWELQHIINNIFFSISPTASDSLEQGDLFQRAIPIKYPFANFSSHVLRLFMEQSPIDWEERYGDQVWGFETLVEPRRRPGDPLSGDRTGEVYRRVGWDIVGQTVGQTCRRVPGASKTERGMRGGVRQWEEDPTKFRPKLVFCYRL